MLESDLVHAFPNTATIFTSKPDMEKKEIKFSVEVKLERKEVMAILEKVMIEADLYGKSLICTEGEAITEAY